MITLIPVSVLLTGSNLQEVWSENRFHIRFIFDVKVIDFYWFIIYVYLNRHQIIMYSIITHYWISTLVAVSIMGGLVLWIASARMNRKETHPLPKSKVKNKYNTKNQGPPLLIRLPKLG